MVKLEKELLMWYLVECLREVEQDSIHLTSHINVNNHQDQLGLA